ncbi:Dolichyl-phosphate-mannose-protein mannosyltransferase [Candidatus Electrothrix communis]|uniref:Dolichyl-phosphate-mannose-protein mannosyltransferase n=1 Tax=Candidatus Electrothrix communis TaxID=1859133 RepID=A0A3S3QVH9_9BACT|nr:Dolichyl-phosphate-mannose-protein mannosyltransferase [Candidatus Electrothrix communis]
MQNTVSTKRGFFILIGVLLAGLLVCLALLAYTPPFSRDALIHHLQLPKLYLQHGGIYELPNLKFSYYPMNLDLLYMGALWLGSGILAKYIHMVFGLGTALLLYAHMRKRLSISYGLLGALFFLSIPIIVKLSITVYVDLGLLFFSTASLLLLFHWLETGKQKKHLILAGLSCGLAIGTKYNGLLVLFLLALMLPILIIRSQPQTKKDTGTALRATVFFCLAALLSASPWLIKNALWTGNPIYPLYNGFFNRTHTAPPPDQQLSTATEKEVKTDEEKKSSGARGIFARRYMLYRENIWQLLLLPVRIFFEGQDNDPRYFDGRLNPFLFLLPFLGFLGITQEKKQLRLEKTTLVAFSVFYFLFAFNTGVLRIRYLAPILPFLVILSMYGLKNLEKLGEKYATRIGLAKLVWPLTVCLLLLWNGSYLSQQFKKIDPFSYITGRLSRDEYLTQQIPEYTVMQYANNNLPESSKILCLFLGSRGYYLDRPHLFDSHGNPNLLLSWLKQPKGNVETVLQNLREQQITHLLVRTDLTAQWLYNAENHQQELWNQLSRNHLIAVHTHLNYILYQVTFR